MQVIPEWPRASSGTMRLASTLICSWTVIRTPSCRSPKPEQHHAADCKIDRRYKRRTYSTCGLHQRAAGHATVNGVNARQHGYLDGRDRSCLRFQVRSAEGCQYPAAMEAALFVEDTKKASHDTASERQECKIASLDAASVNLAQHADLSCMAQHGQ